MKLSKNLQTSSINNQTGEQKELPKKKFRLPELELEGFIYDCGYNDNNKFKLIITEYPKRVMDEIANRSFYDWEEWHIGEDYTPWMAIVNVKDQNLINSLLSADNKRHFCCTVDISTSIYNNKANIHYWLRKIG